MRNILFVAIYRGAQSFSWYVSGPIVLLEKENRLTMEKGPPLAPQGHCKLIARGGNLALHQKIGSLVEGTPAIEVTMHGKHKLEIIILQCT